MLDLGLLQQLFDISAFDIQFKDSYLGLSSLELVIYELLNLKNDCQNFNVAKRGLEYLKSVYSLEITILKTNKAVNCLVCCESVIVELR